MTPLLRALSIAPAWLPALAGPPGGAPSLEQIRAALADLLAALERGGAGEESAALAIPDSAVAVARVGEAIASRVASGALEASPGELAAVNAWTRARLLDCVDALAREKEAAAARDATLRALFAAARIVVIELDPSLRFRWVYDQTTGPFPNQSIVGRSLFELDSSSAEVVGGHMRRVLSSGVGYQTEVAIVDQDGTPVTLLVTLEPTRDAAGAITGVIGVSIDISELKETQGQLASALVFRERVMAVLAHDLRNPLAVVRGLSSLYARRTSLPAEVREGFAHVERAGKRMDELIGTLLDFSAARFNGTIPMSPQAGDLSALAREVLDELGQAMPERRIELESLGDTVGQFDPARISQVISNLAGNALTHGARTEPVRVLVDGRAQPLSLSVRNAGTPIPKELLPVLFEPFRRGVTTAETPRGLGLGLYIAKQIALAHGGSLEVESSYERGTVFTVHLPRKSPRAALGAGERAPAAP